MTIEEKSEAFAEEIYGRMKKEKKTTEMKAYAVDLVSYKNEEKIVTDEFVAMMKSLDGFLGCAPYGGGSECNIYNSPSVAALFDTASNRNKAYRKISEVIECAVVLETGYIPVTR